jgi:hypothetical protein
MEAHRLNSLISYANQTILIFRSNRTLYVSTLVLSISLLRLRWMCSMVLSFGVNEDDKHVSQIFKPLLPARSIGEGGRAT